MDHRTALEVLRLDHLEKQARAYHDRGRESGNARLMVRAARLEEAANAKMMAIARVEVSTYRTD